MVFRAEKKKVSAKLWVQFDEVLYIIGFENDPNDINLVNKYLEEHKARVDKNANDYLLNLKRDIEGYSNEIQDLNLETSILKNELEALSNDNNQCDPIRF